jgi:ABC-type multidrug transport system ATPase subunit
MSSQSIEATNLTRRYGYRVALKKVNITFPITGIHGLFGANGAGKTTLMRIISTLLRPHGGNIRVLGFDPIEESIEVCERIGIVSDKDLLYGELTGYENLSFYAGLYGLRKTTLDENSENLSEIFGVKSWLHEPVKILSTGLRKRFDIIRSLLHEPELLLLDEPFSGLDRDTTEVFKGYLNEIRSTRTIILTTHNLQLGSELCNSFVTLRKGEVLSSGQASEFDGVL